MAVKHDMVQENQNKLQMLLRLMRASEPSTWEQFCEAIVKFLCKEPYPKPDTESIKQFNETILAYKETLKEICQEATENSQTVIHGCLKNLYRQMVEGPDRPCVAASIILALFSNSNIPAAVRWMLGHGENSSDEALLRVFEILTRWLGETTSVQNIQVWMCELLSGLYEERRYDLLFDIAVASAPKLMNFVKIPVFRAQVLPVLQRLLICDGCAPKLFHIVLPRLGEVIRSFNGQIHQQEILFLKTIQELLLQFPEQGDRYKEINNIMVVFKHKLSDELGTSVSSTTPALVRLENNNPRVGLVNLGNTCYMNSVLQALVMTKHFSRELLLSYPRTMIGGAGGGVGGASKTELVFTIQKLLAQLLHSRRPELTPREVLHATRPPSFLPGHQQDSSEFLSHLLDTLHEHEMAVRRQQQQHPQQKRRKRAAAAVVASAGGGEAVDEHTGISVNSSSRQKMVVVEEEAAAAMVMELMEYDEVDGVDLMLKGGEAAMGEALHSTLIQRSFGGLVDTSTQCLNCGEKSTNRDAFRDISLSFGMDKESTYYVQHLLDYYCLSEKLEGENQYHCEKCAKLCDGLRSMSFAAPPKNLILTLKHFKYDQQFHTRAKLMHNVVLNDMVTVKIHHNGGQGPQTTATGKASPVAGSSAAGAAGGYADAGTKLAKYQLYAVVVHSGMSMDAGHYFTYASDEPNSWYMFNDNYVTKCGMADVHRLRAPNTPYILFYRLVETQQQQHVQPEEDGGTESLPELEELPSYLKDFVVKDNFTYCQEIKKGSEAASNDVRAPPFNYRNHNNDSDSDEPPPPPSSCGGNAIDSCNSYIC